jgi:hypothetical protein
MAITNAQQFKQLVNPPMKGNKRPGYRGDDAYGGGDSVAGGGDQGFGGDGPPGPDDRSTAQQTANQRAQVRAGNVRAIEDLIDRPTFGFTDAAKFNITPLPLRVLSGIFSGGTGKVNPPVTSLGGSGGDSQAMAGIPTWMQLGFNSEAEYLASLEDEEDKEDKEDEGLRLAFRANGGRIGFRGGAAAASDAAAGRDAGRDTSAAGTSDRGDGPATGGGPTGNVGGGYQKPPVVVNPLKNLSTHFANNQKLKDAVALGLITNEEYNTLGGYDVKQTMGMGPVDSFIGSLAYNTVQSLKGDQPFGDILGDSKRTAQGATNISPELQATYENIMKMADGGRAGLAEGGMPYEGGIMDLESARQMYGLGKLVKKVTRSVKKIAKSPIGKAALLYAGAEWLDHLVEQEVWWSKGMFGSW